MSSSTEPPTPFLRFCDVATDRLLQLLIILVFVLQIMESIFTPCPCEIVPPGTQFVQAGDYRVPTNYVPKGEGNLVTREALESFKEPYRQAAFWLWVGIPLIIVNKARLPWVKERNRHRLEEVRIRVRNLL